ncbi:uncharacterized protein EI97DRAFT_428831 [Westerdykella ornata]|uniref:Uncharacterized protein n=1 Tax=Westerdykella ornata TaxID=318751 RepID=A0A6A6JXC8_WESOR|nr:uncharacterized protein EI97DRAFT_428831 [Westerdykella ornata]KAF2280723.1 hypothetical protein EI97DRAFT_428831 [Westerdykella ornata]
MTPRSAISRIRLPLSPQLAVPKTTTPIRALRRRGYASQSEGQGQGKSLAGAYYKSFGLPIAKCFLGALFTYQVTYWLWMKLESLEEQKDKEEEIQQLKDELKVLLKRKAEAEKALLAEQGTKAVEGEKAKKKGWFW